MEKVESSRSNLDTQVFSFDDSGYHLLLVTERTNCPRLDGQNTRISRALDGSVLLEGSNTQESRQVGSVLFQQVGFWLGASLAGGVVAELAAKASDVIPTLPWE